jgi:hypothetical protein
MNPICERVRQWETAASPQELLVFFDQLCDGYLRADPPLRAEIRKAVAESPKVFHSLLYDSLSQVGPGSYLVEVAKRAEAEKNYTGYLRSSLLAISLSGGFGDWRDTIVWLGERNKEAKRRGIDARPYFDEISGISDSSNEHGISGMSTRDLIVAGSR